MTILSDLRDTYEYAKAANNFPAEFHVAATERYLRSRLGIKKPTPLTFEGIPVVLVPSAREQKRREKTYEANFKSAQIDFVEGNR